MPNETIKQKISRLVLAALTLAASATLQATEVTREFRGLTLNANLELAANKSLTDDVVLIVHGFTGHYAMEVIQSAQRALIENGYSSLAINLSMGIDNRHGFFECTWSHRYLQEDTIDEVGAWVDWLRKRGTSRIILMGHSRGANQVMVYAADDRDPEVKNLVLLAPGTFDDTKRGFVERYGAEAFERQLARGANLIAAGRGNELMEKTDIMWCPRTSVSANTFMSFYGGTSRFRNFRDYLPRIRIPTLVVTGTVDELSPDTAQELAPYVDGKHLRLSVIEGAGHFFLDFNLDEAIEAAIEFIDDTRS